MRTPVRLLIAVAFVAAFIAVGQAFGYFRAALAILMGLVIAYLGFRRLYKLANAPPDPEPADVSGYGLKYVCGVCGLELRLEVAAKEKPPTHCHEPMMLVTEKGRPPLRSV